MLCSVSRASAGLTEYLIVSSKPPTGYYVDGVTASPVSRASAGWWGLQRSECGVNKCGEALRSSLPQIRSSTRTNDPTSFDHPHTENDRLSSTQQISIFYGVTGSHPTFVTDSVIHAHKRLRTIRSSTHAKYQSTIQHSSNFNFLRGHHLPPIDYARPRRQQSPISTIHLANLRRPLPHLG